MSLCVQKSIFDFVKIASPKILRNYLVYGTDSSLSEDPADWFSHFLHSLSK